MILQGGLLQKGKALLVFRFPLPGHSPKSHKVKHSLLWAAGDTPGSVCDLLLYAADGNGKLCGSKLCYRGIDGFFFHLHSNDWQETEKEREK